MKRILIMVVVLAGCGSGQPQAQEQTQTIATNYGYGWQFDEQGVTGLKARYADDKSPRVAQVEMLFSLVLQCMGSANVEPPFVIFSHEVTQTDGNSAGGLSLPTGTIVTRSIVNDQFYQPLIVENSLRHEMVHDVLRKTGFPEDRNFAHDSPLFDECQNRSGTSLI